MSEKPIHIAGTGCCLMDYLYTRVGFESPTFRKAISHVPGDGGLRPGALVFAEDFEHYIGCPFSEWLEELTGGRAPDAENLGGPAIVSLMHASQMLFAQPVRISFHAGHGTDEAAAQMRAIIERTAVEVTDYRELEGSSPSTVVLSDPDYHEGKGERTFINTLGAAGTYTPDMLSADFFQADIRLFGATALVPLVHDHLEELLQRGREQGGINVVGTVYDFRNEQRHPGRPWPLGRSSASYPLIDLLVCDHEEALKLSGCDDVQSAVRHFLAGGIGAVVVTHGAHGYYLASQSDVFGRHPLQQRPVCQAVDEELDRTGRHVGDTTGCGDNFLGGILTSLAEQMVAGRQTELSLLNACAWGAASGGFACFYAGGTYLESVPGSKRAEVERFVTAYHEQVSREGQ